MEAHEQDARNGELAALHEALSAGTPEKEVAAALKPLHPAQVADFLEALAAEERARLWKLIDSEVKGDILVEAHGEVRRQLIEESSPDELAVAVQRLDLDELSDIYEELPPDVVEAVLRAMDGQRRQRFDVVRTYPEDTAGGLMDVDAITVRPDVTLRMVLNYLARYRAEHGKLPEHTDAVMVVDLGGRYLGQLRLSDLVSLDPERKVHDVVDRAVEPVKADAPASRVARLFQDRDLVSAPVVDEHGALIGRITVDDVIDIIREEESEDILLMAGVSEGEEEVLNASITRNALLRLPWLFAAWLGGVMAAHVIRTYEGISQAILLMPYVPIIVGMGGNVGTQAATIVVRGMATGRIDASRQVFAAFRELRVALTLGAVFGALLGLTTLLTSSPPNAGLAIAVGCSLVTSMGIAATVGSSMPIILSRFGVDPAIATGPFVTTSIDVLGIIAYFTIAGYLVFS